MTRQRRSSPQTLAILEAMVAQPRSWRHGYELSTETSLPSGTLYPVLMRLSDRGFLEFEWQESEIEGRPPRRMYRLTSDGLKFAKAELARSRSIATGKPATGRA